MKFENQTFIYANKYHDNMTPPVGEIEWSNDIKNNEINFCLKVRGIIDSRENSIEEFKKELEELLIKYLI